MSQVIMWGNIIGRAVDLEAREQDLRPSSIIYWQETPQRASLRTGWLDGGVLTPRHCVGFPLLLQRIPTHLSSYSSAGQKSDMGSKVWTGLCSLLEAGGENQGNCPHSQARGSFSQLSKPTIARWVFLTSRPSNLLFCLPFLLERTLGPAG